MVARNELDILQRNLDDFPAYAIMVANHEVAGRKGVIPANPVKQVLDWNHNLPCRHPFLISSASILKVDNSLNSRLTLSCNCIKKGKEAGCKKSTVRTAKGVDNCCAHR